MEEKLPENRHIFTWAHEVLPLLPKWGNHLLREIKMTSSDDYSITLRQLKVYFFSLCSRVTLPLTVEEVRMLPPEKLPEGGSHRHNIEFFITRICGMVIC